MRIAIVAVLCAALMGCGAGRREVAARLGEQYIGKNVDVLVGEFGPPASSFKMNSGQTAYVWQLSAITNIDTDRYGGTAETKFCKVNVLASPSGIVTQLTTEDAENILGSSLCAKRLGMQRQS